VLAWPAVLALAVLLPFELVKPQARMGPVVFTNVELLAGLTVALWIVDLLLARRRPAWPRWWLWPVVAWVVVVLGSAWLAPFGQEAALKFAVRSCAGVAVGLVVVDVIARTPGRLPLLILALLCGGTAAALTGWLEVLLPAQTSAWLSQFKLLTTRVAGTIRASGTFGYANIAAQYWEVILVLLVTWMAAVQLRPLLRLAAWLAVLVVAGALVLTASRGGLLAVLAGLVFLALATWTSRRLMARQGLPTTGSGAGLLRSAGWMAIAAAAVVLIVAGVHLAITPTQQARLRREVETGFQRAAYEVPARLTLTAGERVQVPVRITNLGELPWKAAGQEPVRLSYHWLDASGANILYFEGDRTALAADVAPGASQAVEAYVLPPNTPGDYVLGWDLLQDQVAWFSTRGVPLGHTAVTVTSGTTPVTPGPPVTPVPVALLGQAQATNPVPRTMLWRAAFQMWQQYPLLGVGPDNFRYRWGDELGLSGWRDSASGSVLHSNNLYLEILATLGLAGLTVFIWLLGALLTNGWRTWQRWLGSPGTRLLWLLGLNTALLVFLVHGLFDYFLEFTPTYLLWWIVLASLVAIISPDTRHTTNDR
jgi:hypothetical protein